MWNGDGDMDVLSASVLDDKIAWYENDGNENFTPHTITTGANRATSVYAVDVDGDGDIDVLSTSDLDNKIAWYENLSPVGIEAISIETPSEFSLSQSYPNPFNPSTKIRYQIPQESKVIIKLYDILGAEVITLLNEKKEPGVYEIDFNAQSDAGGLPSGIYIYRLVADGFIETKKMVLLR